MSTQVNHVIDLDADPFVPEGWEVESHGKGGQFEWSPDKVRLHPSPNQQNGKVIRGYKLLEELAAESVFNANMLDYLLLHPELIPEEWKGKVILFWGTIYYDSGNLYVRCLYLGDKHWCWSYRWLDHYFGGGSPAACSQISSN